MNKNILSKAQLKNFSKNFDHVYEDSALSYRGEFLQDFPLDSINSITLDDYVIGKKTASFCYQVEVKTRAWANIQGATASKFGIYFGKSKSDPTLKYRITKKFATTKIKAFNSVKKSLLSLIVAGEKKEFYEIDKNPLSQMFKAKILSLYFPDIYLNICSSDHIILIASELGITNGNYISEYQHLLLKKKYKNSVTKSWSNPKYMSFLYAKFIRKDLKNLDRTNLQKPKKKKRKEVDFDELNANRDRIGKMSEKFALNWEKSRLIGLGYRKLIKYIKDRRKIPSYGYDFLSYSETDHERYIEVKSLGYDKKEGCYRFFLSENELMISKTDSHYQDYFFYLVLYGSDGKPKNLVAKKAMEVHRDCDIIPCAYTVRFEIENFLTPYIIWRQIARNKILKSI